VSAPEPDLAAFLQDYGLASPGEAGRWTPLPGGISSDIWRVETASHRICVKRARAQLKVPREWKVPTDRNAYEWAYMQIVTALAPGAVPAPIAHDERRGLFAMAWLAPDQHPLWKSELLAGRVDPGFAAAVGDLLGRIHSATARDAAARFATDATFHAIRIEPYLLATAQAHPDLRGGLQAIAVRTGATRRALVHGDISPKNILAGPGGPVLLDAECAWFGDPAFDLAFCLNHLTIKRRVVQGAADALALGFDRLVQAYFAQVDWEPAAELEARTATLLPALALARVDGKSPLEYLNEAQRASLRADARAALQAGATSLQDVKAALAPR
jgi:aminoglycoside phosphotransferase (APT) family kinase protein